MIKKKPTLIKGCDELTRFFQLEAEEKGLKLILEKLLPPEKNSIITDQNKFDSILTNLIKNAIKYTETGTITIGCRYKGSELEFYIKDTGIGIPAHRHEAVFNRFEQADIADTGAIQGSGLGLAISKAYVEILGGNIWLESEEGKGSTFYFTLPAKNNVKERSNTEKEISFESEKAKSRVKALKILIVEDDEASRYYISLIVNDVGSEILEAETGTDAIELCRNNKDIDLILMDIKMPGMDGYEATRRIREFNKEVVIITQTAYGLAGDREKAIESGCNDYIAKPVNIDDLFALIQKYFRK
ncbi:MAG: response regulator [Candidatus Marinimicrobia bacterium]|nr:response regulator [Candidatus Neomarinimicrobiota bacterium]